MAISGQLIAKPLRAAPETAILLLLTALYLMTYKRRFLNQINILRRRLPLEIFKIAGVTLTSAAALSLAAGVWQGLAGFSAYINAAAWLPVFLTGIFFIIPLGLLFMAAQRRDSAESLKFYHLLWPVLLACFLIMMPDLMEYIANSPKTHEFLHAKPGLQRA